MLRSVLHGYVFITPYHSSAQHHEMKTISVGAQKERVPFHRWLFRLPGLRL
jgi:hypothetical protein